MRGLLTFLGLFVAGVAAVYLAILSPSGSKLTNASLIAKEVKSIPQSQWPAIAAKPRSEPVQSPLDLSTDPVERPDPDDDQAFGIPPNTEQRERAKPKVQKRRLARARAAAKRRWMRDVFQQDD